MDNPVTLLERSIFAYHHLTKILTFLKLLFAINQLLIIYISHRRFYQGETNKKIYGPIPLKLTQNG